MHSHVIGNALYYFISRTFPVLWEWALTTTLSSSTLLKNTLSKVSFSNLQTNVFLDHSKASEDFIIFTLLTFTLSKTTILKV